MDHFEHPDFCANLSREEILEKFRTEKLKNSSLQKVVDHFKKQTTVEIKVRGGYWWITRRPRGKGSSKLGGTYIRVPGQK